MVIFHLVLVMEMVNVVWVLGPPTLHPKMLIVVSVLGLEAIFDSITRIIRKKKITINVILDKSLMHALLILLGFLLFNDIKVSQNIMSKIPGLSEIINIKSTKLFIMILPIIIFTTSKCFLKPY